MDLRHLALQRIPSAIRDDAANVADLLADGYRPGEVATITGLNRQRVNEMQKRIREGMVAALEDDGYSQSETIRYLGVPTAMVSPHLR